MPKPKPKYPESLTGYSCPNCGAICGNHTILYKTEPEFSYQPDPHYFWEETHKCKKCETIYTLKNST